MITPPPLSQPPSPAQPVTTAPLRPRRGAPGPRDALFGLLVAAAAGAIASVWAWFWLGREMGNLSDELGLPVDVPSDRVVDFGILTAAMVLLAWLVGAHTRLGRLAAPVVAGALIVWTALAYWLSDLPDVFPAWPGFEGPFDFGKTGEIVRSLTWLGIAGPLAVAVLAAVAAWLGTTGRGAATADAPTPSSASHWGSSLVGGVVVLGILAYLTLEIATWPSDLLGPWPAGDLMSEQYVYLALAVAVAWITSGRSRGVVALSVLATIGLLHSAYVTASVAESALLTLLGATTVALAAAHRPFARTLRATVV